MQIRSVGIGNYDLLQSELADNATSQGNGSCATHSPSRDIVNLKLGLI